jgi:UDP:flavonoid glycosyltransferase YjiC (YdhE family)
MKILVAWELGDNYGHVLRQLPIAKELRRRGHDVLFAVKDVAIAQQTLHASGVAFIQAPVTRRKRQLDREIASFADILAFHGFAEQAALHSLGNSWQHLYRLYQPDVMVVDHAPAALFAARLLGIPVAEIGMGFEIPPPVSPYPCFRPWLNLPNSELEQCEEAILANVNALCEAQEHPSFRRLTELMQSDLQLLTTLPEFDHYPQRKNGRYVGPILTLDDGLVVDWPECHAKNIFVYLRPGGALPAILDTLRQTNANIICVVPGIDTGMKEKYESAALHIHTSYVKLEPLLKRCDLAIGSGPGVGSACLLAGVPMLVLPNHIEQMLFAESLVRTGMGLALSLNAIPMHFAAVLDKLLSDPRFAQRAQAMARKYKSYDQDKSVERIANSIERLPGHVAGRKRHDAGNAPVNDGQIRIAPSPLGAPSSPKSEKQILH